jgi:uncharacterized protein (UPF0548 family)
MWNGSWRRLVTCSLSYDPVGLAGHGRSGFKVDEQTTIVGSGEAAFERATAALIEWRHFELGWLELFPKRASSAPGTVVAVSVRHLGFWSLNGCRVVYSIGVPGDRTFGFAYGTLTRSMPASMFNGSDDSQVAEAMRATRSGARTASNILKFPPAHEAS